MKFPHALFKRAGLNSTDVASLAGVSRVTGFRWLSGVDRNGKPGVGVNPFLEDKVRRLESSIRLAYERGALPSKDLAKLPPEKRARALKKIVHQNRV